MNFLMFGGLIFWSVIAFVCILLLFTVESYSKHDEIHRGELGWPGFIICAAIVFMCTCGDRDQLWWSLKMNAGSILLWLSIYLIAGIIWSFFKWFKVVKRAKERYLREAGSPRPISSFVPKVNQWKESITSWILFWPFSILRYAFGTMLMDFMNAIVSRLKGLYDRISLRVFGIDKSELDK